MTGPLLRAEGLVRHFHTGGAIVRALDGVDLAFEPGECVAFMGPSGSGKSTLLALLAGLDTPTGGRVILDGRDLSSLSDEERSRARNRDVGMIFQNFHLAAHLDVLQNLALPLAVAGTPRREREARGLALLERIGLASRARHRPDELSGGERQRLAVARAILHRPRIVLADEPTGQLDTATGDEVLALLEAMRADAGAALLIATHDEHVAKRAGRIVRLCDGRVEAEERASPAGGGS